MQAQGIRSVNAAEISIRPGKAFPPGATATADGINFSVFSRHGKRVWLVLYAGESDPDPLAELELDPDKNRTYFFWHILVAGLAPGVHYTWRVDGPEGTAANGFRFDRRRELLDPWARCVSDARWDRRLAETAPASGSAFRASVPDADDYDWGDDAPVNRSLNDCIIYEMHVGGFTRHPSSQARSPGTFQAVVEKIPYLKSLGITDVELLPVMAFDAQEVPPATRALGLTNYWGYSPVGYFAPHAAYCATDDPIREFRDMVRALHSAGIGVILDVVLNHTAEGGENGPVIHFKGFGNEIYYHLDPGDRRRYRDFTGCGNSVNCNHPIVAHYLKQCIEYWVREMHVDGFRFDLASVLARGEDGAVMHHAPLLWSIEFSEVTTHTKLIAEAWDTAGADLVGDFPGFRWSQWNGRYRDVVRRFVRGDKGVVPELATRMAGSSDLFSLNGGLPTNSINYVTCHDGFTLHDLVSYDARHNEANGEGNRDGHETNYSWNCGVEGPTADAAILALRRRQARNHIAILLLSQGVPMLLSGDEVLRTQRGNNNAYCQDNAVAWFDWELVDKNADMLRFTREMIAFRKRHETLRRNRFFAGARGSVSGAVPDVQWHGQELNKPRWTDFASRTVAFTLAASDTGEPGLHVMLNMSERVCEMDVPALPSAGRWGRAIDTSLETPADISRPGEQVEFTGSRYRLDARSVVVLEGRR